ncbi:endonuclease/exonuclease/phosphatase, partial [filamentous cyanobacterium CCP5]
MPQVSAEDRLFLDLQVDFLDRYDLPQQGFEGTTVGGLSAIAYDPLTSELYALSDDRGRYGPPRFYRLNLDLSSDRRQITSVTVESVTPLTQTDGQPFPAGQLDPEGMALSPRQTVLISSEGNAAQAIPSFLGEFDRSSGQLINQFRLPDRYLPSPDPDQPSQGVQNNLSLESLTLSAG